MIDRSHPLQRAPLQGKTVLVTRPRQQAQEMAQLIEQKGGEAYVSPFIDQEEAGDIHYIQQALEQLDVYDVLLFTSGNGVRFFMHKVRKLEQGGARWQEKLSRKKIVAVGPKTARVAEDYGLPVAFIAHRYQQEYVAQKLIHLADQRDQWQGEQAKKGKTSPFTVLFPRAKKVRSHLFQALGQKGIIVDDFVVYETKKVLTAKETLQQKLKQNEVDVLTFTSPSTLEAFVQWLKHYMDEEMGHKILQESCLACIGTVTADTAQKLGLIVDVMATEQTGEGLVQALEEYFREESSQSSNQ